MRRMNPPEADEQRTPVGLPTRLAIELVIGLSLTVVLVIVAFATSKPIAFVYGGY